MSEFNLSPLRPILKEFAIHGRTALLPALHAAQSQYGYIPEPVAVEIGRALNVPLADVFGVIEFYSMFYDQPVGKTVIRVCCDPACALAGSDRLLEAICRKLEVSPEDVSADRKFSVERSPCLGLCEHAPAVLAGEQAISQADPLDISGLMA
jgi:NADH-quinone oxidoreductase subunit F